MIGIVVCRIVRRRLRGLIYVTVGVCGVVVGCVIATGRLIIVGCVIATGCLVVVGCIIATGCLVIVGCVIATGCLVVVGCVNADRVALGGGFLDNSCLATGRSTRYVADCAADKSASDCARKATAFETGDRSNSTPNNREGDRVRLVRRCLIVDSCFFNHTYC